MKNKGTVITQFAQNASDRHDLTCDWVANDLTSAKELSDWVLHNA